MSNATLPTLEDVAREAKVSTATVSRCLNTPERVSETTRDKVLEAVRTLGYSPNFGARALASKRTYTYGAIIPTMANAIFARGLQAFQEHLSSRGITLLVASSSYDPEEEEKQIRNMVARGADGLLLIGTSRSEEIYQFLEQHNVPLVLAWNINQSSTHNMVGFNNIEATRKLTARAVAQGHRDFAYISAELQYNDRARDRLEGVKRGLQDALINPKSIELVEAPYSIGDSGAAFEQLMHLARRPSVVMCGNDVQAVGALKRARELGIRVPEDVSITGFDDLELATVVEPGITTVHVPHREMGRRAAELLLATEPGATTQRIELETHVVERGSLGPVPQAIS